MFGDCWPSELHRIHHGIGFVMDSSMDGIGVKSLCRYCSEESASYFAQDSDTDTDHILKSVAAGVHINGQRGRRLQSQGL